MAVILEYLISPVWYIAALIPVLILSIVFRPSIKSVLLGAAIITLAAMVIETMYISYIGESSLFLFVLFITVIAPIIEESLKLIGTRYGMRFKNAIGIGYGFAIVENAFYYAAYTALGIPFMTLILLRGFEDPLMHATATSLTVRVWKAKQIRWFFAGVVLHGFYNFLGVLPLSYFSWQDITMISIMFIGMMALLHVNSRMDEGTHHVLLHPDDVESF